MVAGLPRNREHLDWLRAHGIDPERTVDPVQVTAAPTREHPRRVIVDYETVHGGEGGVQGRTRGQLIANEPPPPAALFPRPAPDVTEVFEVVERLTGQRAMEHVHLTATAALDWLERQPEKYHTRYRVQSVRVFVPPTPKAGA